MSIFRKSRKCLLFGIDTLIFIVIYIISSLIMIFSSSSVQIGKQYAVLNALTFFVCIFASRIIGRVYSNLWRYANVGVYLQIVLLDAAGGLLSILLTYVIKSIYLGVWQSITFVALFDLATLGSRFVYQLIYRNRNSETQSNKIGVAIVGAGQTGCALAEELLYSSSSHYKPLFFIDNNPAKIDSRISGIPVYGASDNIIDIIKSMPVSEIFIAINSADNESISKLYDFYKKTGCKVKLYDFPLTDNITKGKKRVIRDFNIEDLLFRDTITICDGETKNFYTGKRILVTGGGGSIGSELCRQLASLQPAELVIFDIYENNAYSIQQELIYKYGSQLNLHVEIGSVRDAVRLEAVFKYYKPEIVFHAAAHKHVPLMEHSSCEAIKNNVYGTVNTADMAEKYGVKKFILISTDKAVNPTNIMGASKRMCEMVVQCRYDSQTVFSAVRFGNVLGSNGSVIPLFKRQIENGGPVTITDKEITRFFMTIPEASQLVLEAGAMAKSNELFVLDMGKPVKILELAENMIRLSGFEPYKDIEIIETGLRPGEKLYEELLMKNDNLEVTQNHKIFIEKAVPFTREQIGDKLYLLARAVEMSGSSSETSIVKNAMKEAVTTYHDPDEINSKVMTKSSVTA